MPRRRIHHVLIALDRETVVLPWTSQQALLERLRGDESMHEIVQAFEAVGTSLPVELTPGQRSALVDAISVWKGEAGVEGPAEGIGELRDALHDDLRESPST